MKQDLPLTGFGFQWEGEEPVGEGDGRWYEVKPDENKPYQATNCFIRSRDYGLVGDDVASRLGKVGFGRVVSLCGGARLL